MEAGMRNRLPSILVALVLSLASIPATAQSEAHTRWSRIERTPGFAGWKAQLQHMADAFGTAPVNHMCVVVATYTQPSVQGATVWGYLYWRENNQLYTLSQSKDAMSDLSLWQAPLDLKTGVVRRRQDIGSSTFLETRAWVNTVLRHCRSDGTEIVVKRSHA